MQIRIIGARDGKEIVKEYVYTADLFLPRIGETIKLPYFTSTELRDYRLKKVRVVDIVYNVEQQAFVFESFQPKRQEPKIDIIVELEKEYELAD